MQTKTTKSNIDNPHVHGHKVENHTGMESAEEVLATGRDPRIAAYIENKGTVNWSWSDIPIEIGLELSIPKIHPEQDLSQGANKELAKGIDMMLKPVVDRLIMSLIESLTHMQETLKMIVDPVTKKPRELTDILDQLQEKDAPVDLDKVMSALADQLAAELTKK